MGSLMEIQVKAVVCFRALCVCVVALTSAIGSAVNLSKLFFNTGVDASGKPLTFGKLDPHYTLEGGKAYAIPNYPTWIAASSDDNWINPTGNVNTFFATRDYIYHLTVDLTGVDTNGLTVSGQWATDDRGVLKLNGVTAATIAGFSAYKSFTLSGFVPGVNDLSFTVHNDVYNSGLVVKFFITPPSPVSLNWSKANFTTGQASVPLGLTTGSPTANSVDLIVSAYQQPSGGGPGMGVVMNARSGALLPIDSSGGTTIANFLPVGLTNNVPAGQVGSGDYRVLGWQTEKTGYKARYLGGGAGHISGPLDFEYTANDSGIDRALAVGPYPYGSYATAAISTVTGPSFSVFHPGTGAPKDNLVFSDPALNASNSSFAGKLILAAGADTRARSVGGARASAYTISPTDGSVSQAFTKTIANSLVGRVFTFHEFRWGGSSEAFNVLVDNREVFDAAAGTSTSSYRLMALDQSGKEIWSTSYSPGNVFRLSVGSSKFVYALITRVPGQVVAAFDQTGLLLWSKPTRAVRLCAAQEQGVVVADNEWDETKHHHIHLTRYDTAGTVTYTTSYSSSPNNDDFLSEVLWDTGHVYIVGSADPGNGQQGLFGAQFDEH